MPNLVVVGTQWGDEGKGKIVDILSEFSDVVVRYQGGANAGHTLVCDKEQLITHLVPSGVLHPNKQCVIGPAVVVDPELLAQEISELKKRNLLSKPGTLTVSHRAHVVMPYHKQLDAAREAARGANKIGTTLRGIGPCLEDKVARSGVRLIDFLNRDLLTKYLTARLGEVNAVIAYYGGNSINVNDLLPHLYEQFVRIKPYINDASVLVKRALETGRTVLFEGAQGALLDIDYGTYPFVTSSNTLASAACTGLGFSPRQINGILGVTKAYTTRVGEGPCPTELTDERGRKLQQDGAEFGATTGRVRRCGWLDLVALRYAVNINGCTSLCLTKLDVLTHINPLRLAVGYQLDGEEIDDMPGCARTLTRVKPIYEDVEGWSEDIRDVRERKDLPTGARRYVEYVENFVNIPVDIISIGPTRAQTIVSHNPFRTTR